MSSLKDKKDYSEEEILSEDNQDSKKGKKGKKKSKSKKYNKKLIIIILVSIAIFLVLGITLYVITPKIYLNGKSKVVLNYNDSYQELGSTAKYLGKDITNKIKTTGKVNTKKVGKYKVTYHLKVFIWNISKNRVVRVVDKKNPEIVLEGEKEINICPNVEYKEIGYTAVDEYDGDLTKKVKVTEKEDKIIYEVEDSSHNKVTVERKINKVDNEKPNIELAGSNPYYHRLNNAFKEPGYTASDNCDQDLTNKVEVTGNVNVNKEGKYTLIYTVEDSNHNKTSVERTVQVYKKVDVNSGITKNGVIYLTFDDGPSSETTPKILDILKEEGVKATFFVTNNGPDSLLKREYDEGHAIALHTASHDYQKIYSSTDNYFSDLKIVSDRVKRVTGTESFIIRFPGGSSNTVSRKYNQGIMTVLTNEVLNRGYRYYDWNVDASDAWSCAKNNVLDKKGCVYNNVVNNLSKGKANIVLMHDIKYHTVDALRSIIQYGKNNGYTFEAIDMNTAMVRFKVNN